MLPPLSSPHSTGTLCVISLPIGNPEDITLRALRLLREVHLIVTEDARLTRTLLRSFSAPIEETEPEIVSLRPRRGVPALAAALACLAAGHDVALVADSGTPLVVEPGLGLIQVALRHGHRVTAVPGATACLAALVLSGFSPTPFQFLGIPPRSPAERTAFFAALTDTPHTLILYESPRYLHATLSALSQSLGSLRKIVVACDLTHTNEQVFRGTISAALTAFAGHTPAGQYTLVISGDPSSRDEPMA